MPTHKSFAGAVDRSNEPITYLGSGTAEEGAEEKIYNV